MSIKMFDYIISYQRLKEINRYNIFHTLIIIIMIFFFKDNWVSI